METKDISVSFDDIEGRHFTFPAKNLILSVMRSDLNYDIRFEAPAVDAPGFRNIALVVSAETAKLIERLAAEALGLL